MTGGFVLGERHRNQVATTPGDTTTTPQSSESSWAADPKSCPSEAIDFAIKEKLPSDLKQIFKVVTVNGTTVWICEDGAGSLYYQSKTGGVDAPLVQGENGLFLTRVVRDGDNAYEATAANGNTFMVNTRRLEVRFADGRTPQINTVETVE
ncbi:hypothetical protein ACQPZX_07265 [Actinoplanes sp. CA-142083]|uniref:hypothetical protein n=1 Tax=Actinoplanes sp. CA-142083 TaxID=3239903 RepID=UPI003D8DC45C